MNELLGIVQDLRLYIAQEYPDLVLKEPLQPKPRAVQAAQAPTPPPPRPKAPPLAAVQPPKPKEKEKELAKGPVIPLMQALNRPFSKPIRAPLLDVLDRFDKLGIKRVELEKEKPVQTKQEITFVSFFSPGSEEEQFIKKVAASVNERLLPTRLYTQPSLEMAAYVYSLAAARKAKAIIIAYPQDLASQMASFLSYFGDDLHKETRCLSLLNCQHTLFDVSFFDLALSKAQMNDQLFKRALWSDLQTLV